MYETFTTCLQITCSHCLHLQNYLLMVSTAFIVHFLFPFTKIPLLHPSISFITSHTFPSTFQELFGLSVPASPSTGWKGFPSFPFHSCILPPLSLAPFTSLSAPPLLHPSLQCVGADDPGVQAALSLLACLSNLFYLLKVLPLLPQ